MTVTKVVMPQLFAERGTIRAWRKEPGDRVARGDLLLEIETDAIDIELEADASGVLRAILIPTGEEVTVGALLGVIAEPNDDLAALLATAEPAEGSAGERAREKPDPASPSSPRREVPAESVRAPLVASERRCRACEKPLTRRQRGACSAKCRATLSRQRNATVHQQRNEELRGLALAARRALEALERRLEESR